MSDIYLSKTRNLGNTVLAVIILLLVLLLGGTIGYVLIEGWPWRTALFMTVITISTVGYGEEIPLSTRGEYFTMALIVLGVGSAAYTFTTFTDYIIAGELRGAWRRQRMKREIEKLTDHYIICGFGRVGQQVVDGLRDSGFDVVVIDSDPVVADALETGEIDFLLGSAADDEILIEAGITRARGLASCLPHDANNVFVVLSARALNPDLTIIARSNLVESAAKLRIAGADQIINPYLITGRRMAAQLVHPTLVEFLDVVMQRGELELRIEDMIIAAGSPMDGKTLAECHVRSETGANVLAVREVSGTIHTNIGPDYLLRAGDTLVSLGTPEQLALLAERTVDRSSLSQLVPNFNRR
ncbi:MAG: NAD-binding protein [Caldilineaceae bacterium]|nr:NAD-binding protein [Caldilineaceae bacterium]